MVCEEGWVERLRDLTNVSHDSKLSGGYCSYLLMLCVVFSACLLAIGLVFSNIAKSDPYFVPPIPRYILPQR